MRQARRSPLPACALGLGGGGQWHRDPQAGAASKSALGRGCRPYRMTTGQERWLRVTAALSGHRDNHRPVLSELCSVCVETLMVTGAGITLMGSDDTQASMGASDPLVERLEELEFTLGQGPCGDAYRQATPVFETDLLQNPPAAWPAFASYAVEVGLHAVFAFPLQIGAARLGVLALYQRRPGALGDATSADAFVMADVITRTILDMHAGVPEESLMNMMCEEGAYQAEVHQASGMISVQLDVSVGEALALLRARAFALDRRIGDVAADVVARRMRFEE